MDDEQYSIQKVIKFLGGGIDEATIAMLVSVFVSSVNSDFPALIEAINNDDKNNIHKIGHKFKGSSANLGFETFRKLCEDLEQHARNNLDFDYKNTFEKLVVEKDSIESWFNSIKSNYGL